MALISDLPNATPQKSDLMEIQNGQTSSNNSSVGQLMQLSASENLAPAYDANAGVYEVGDFVSYDGTLYQCNTAIATPEAFDATKWDAIKVTEITSGASVIQLTQAEYTALSTAEKMNGSIYKLTDKAIFYCLDEEYHPVKELTTAQYEALTSAQQNNGTIYIQTDAETTGEDIPVSNSDSTTIAEAIGGVRAVTTGSITTNSGFNLRGTPIVKKVNKVVQVQFNINADTEFTSRQTIGRLSEGFRPSATLAFSVMASSAVNYFANRMTSLLITATGDLIVGDIVVPSGVNIKEVVASVSFIVE